MISRKKAKFIKSLHLKKFRKQEQLFLVEGAKSVLELLNADFQTLMLLCSPNFYEKNKDLLFFDQTEINIIDEKVLSSLSTLKTNHEVLAVVRMKPNQLLPIKSNDWTIALDDVRDPGNLGTIIRIADWYGVRQIIASPGTAEMYNPKVIHASMGSFIRINIFYCELNDILVQIGKKVFGALMEGENIHHLKSPDEGGVILMGNESRGINPELFSKLDQKVTIPRIGQAESLNVAIATAIICDNLIRI